MPVQSPPSYWPFVFALDEAQRAGNSAAELYSLLSESLRGAHRLIVLGRRVPDSLRGEGSPVLTESDLSLRESEVAALFTAGFDQPLLDADASAVTTVLRGWPAALVLSASRWKTAGAALLSARETPAGFLDDVLSGLRDSVVSSPVLQDVLTLVGHAPTISRAVIASVLGVQVTQPSPQPAPAGVVDELAFTGSRRSPAVPIGLALLVVGGSLVAVARRRRQNRME